MKPPSSALKTNNSLRFQVDDWLIIWSNVVASDRCSQVPFQKRLRADMCIHLWIEETALNMGISGTRKRNVGASEQFIDGHVPSSHLSYPHGRTDTVMFHPDLNWFLNSLNERARNSMRGFRIRPCQTKHKFVIANACEDFARFGAFAYPRTDLQKHLLASDVPIHLFELSKLIESQQQNAYSII